MPSSPHYAREPTSTSAGGAGSTQCCRCWAAASLPTPRKVPALTPSRAHEKAGTPARIHKVGRAHVPGSPRARLRTARTKNRPQKINTRRHPPPPSPRKRPPSRRGTTAPDARPFARAEVLPHERGDRRGEPRRRSAMRAIRSGCPTRCTAHRVSPPYPSDTHAGDHHRKQCETRRSPARPEGSSARSGAPSLPRLILPRIRKRSNGLVGWRFTKPDEQRAHHALRDSPWLRPRARHAPAPDEDHQRVPAPC